MSKSSRIIDGLTTDTLYSFNVRAKNTMGVWSVLNTVGTHTTLKDTTAPAVLSSITLLLLSGVFHLKWAKPTTLDLRGGGFKVYVFTSNTSASAVLIREAGYTSDSILISVGEKSQDASITITAGTTYYFWVTTLDASGNESAKVATTPGSGSVTAAGTGLDHGALTGLADDDHTQYTLKATLTEIGDLYYASGVSTPAALAHANAGNFLQSGGHGAAPSFVDHTGAVDPHTQYLKEADLLITLGTELAPAITQANWTEGAGWTITDLTGIATRVASAVTTLVPTSAIVPDVNKNYKLTFTISSWSAGTMTVTLGGVESTALQGDQTVHLYVSPYTTGNLIFTPDANFAGVITLVSVKEYTGGEITIEGGINYYDSRGHENRLSHVTRHLSEMQSLTLLDKSRSTLSCTGGVLTYTLYAVYGELTWNFNGVVYPIDLASASVALTGGTDAAPRANFVNCQLVGNVPTMTVTLDAEPTYDHICLAVFIVGAVSGSTYTIYSYERKRNEVDTFVKRTIHRSILAGALYESGALPTVLIGSISIASGGKWTQGIFPMTSANTVTSAAFYFIKNGSWVAGTALSDLLFYSNGVAVGNHEFANIVWGICPTTTTASGTIASTVKLIAVLQTDPTVNYSTLATARQDLYEATNYFPPDAELKKTFLPIARTIVSEDNPTEFQTFDTGLYWKDLRGRITSGGGAAVATDVSGLVPKSILTERGDIIYASAVETPAALPHGTAGQVLITGGDAANPSWSSAPTITFANANHTHQAAGTGGTLDHGLALTGLLDDDHTIYPLLLGRAGGQVLKGGTGVTDILSLQGTAGNGTAAEEAIQFLVGNAGGTIAATILNNGNVGIGTVAPGVLLDVAGIGHFDNYIRMDSAGTAGVHLYDSTQAADYKYGLLAVSGGTLSLSVLSDAGASLLVGFGMDKTGIGLAKVVQPLSVELVSGDTGVAISAFNPTGGNVVQFRLGSSASYRFDFWRSSSTGALHIQGNQLGYENICLCPTSGYVGIGTGSPLTTLEVQGGLTTVGSVLTLGTKETTVVVNDVLGRINFYAPLEADGSDAILMGASIVALAEDTFSATVNKTSLLFQTGASEVATTKMTILSDGKVGIGIAGPLSKLHIYNDTTTNVWIDTALNGVSNLAFLDGTTGYWTISHRGTFDAPNRRLGFYNSGAEIFTLTQTSRVGILNVNPATTLDVQGTIKVWDSGDATFLFGTAHSLRYTVGAAGAVPPGTDIGYVNLEAVNYPISAWSHLILQGRTTMGLGVGYGFVGIGAVTDPRSMLDVAGSILSTDFIRAEGYTYPPTTGAGLEMGYTGGIGYLTSYNRAGSVGTPLILRGSTAAFHVGTGLGTTAVCLTSAGLLGIGTSAPDGLLSTGLDNGQQISYKSLTELTVIAAAATTTTTIAIPANVIVKAVQVRVTVLIPTAATFTVTGNTSGTVFNIAAVAVAAGTTDKGNLDCPHNNAASQTIRITPNASPADNTGRVRVTIWYEDSIPPTS